MTKDAFVSEYRAALLANYAWAQDAEKLERFLATVRRTLDTGVAHWNKDGEAVVRAWRAIGGKGKPTYKALYALS